MGNLPFPPTSTWAIVAIRPRSFHGLSTRPHIGMIGHSCAACAMIGFTADLLRAMSSMAR